MIPWPQWLRLSRQSTESADVGKPYIASEKANIAVTNIGITALENLSIFTKAKYTHTSNPAISLLYVCVYLL